MDSVKIKEKKHLVWTEKSHKEVLNCRIFSVCLTEQESACGKKGLYYYIHSPDWVNVVPVVKNQDGKDCFIMVWQYRHGSRSVTLEFPGGIKDEGESPEHGAVRELREETGYSPGSLHFAGKINPNPAFMDNTVYTFVALDCRLDNEQDLDENEIVDVELVPVEEVERNMGREPYINAIIMVALEWYRRWKTGSR